MSKATHAAGGANWLTTTDHKRIALQFLWWTCGAFLLGAIYAIILRLRVTSGLVDPELYRQMLTQHGILMVFLFLVPAIPSVLGNYLLPMQLGVGELRLPWLTRLSLRLQMAGTVLLVDEFTRSKWTVTQAACLLLEIGAEEVVPVVAVGGA